MVFLSVLSKKAKVSLADFIKVKENSVKRYSLHFHFFGGLEKQISIIGSGPTPRTQTMPILGLGAPIQASTLGQTKYPKYLRVFLKDPKNMTTFKHDIFYKNGQGGVAILWNNILLCQLSDYGSLITCLKELCHQKIYKFNYSGCTCILSNSYFAKIHSTHNFFNECLEGPESFQKQMYKFHYRCEQILWAKFLLFQNLFLKGYNFPLITLYMIGGLSTAISFSCELVSSGNGALEIILNENDSLILVGRLMPKVIVSKVQGPGLPFYNTLNLKFFGIAITGWLCWVWTLEPKALIVLHGRRQERVDKKKLYLCIYKLHLASIEIFSSGLLNGGSEPNQGKFNGIIWWLQVPLISFEVFRLKVPNSDFLM
ncbi:hypothetical protein VP01_4768g2 [Puccinia sorghi]|uniref:Uncharacterized protein n=1 Tax=Puccinia sorghi TaxID=27349 RepID=A0A0L6UNG6_9BASI|nr:hypothetical protein VP01_4768g2 [Puccinia sorghi]